jgi:hypothetical protein
VIDEESELDRLYSTPLEQFVKVRNDLVGRLKKDGDHAAAIRIGALKKPSVSAWVVNQLAVSHQVDLQRLIKAGEAIERAQHEALSGEGSGGFETARRDEAAAIRLLRTAAKDVLPSASPATLDRIEKTLRAAAATPEGRELIKQGRLTEDLEPPGFEALSGLAAARPAEKSPSRSASGKDKQRQAKMEALLRKKREADENAKLRADEAAELEREAREADELASRANRAAATARKRADTAAEQARRIESDLVGLET